MSLHAVARRSLACVAVLLLAVSAVWAAPPASVIYFKDGYAIKGRVSQPHDSFIDSVSGQSISVAKGFYVADDVCRYFFFSHVYFDRGEPRPLDFGKRIIRKNNKTFLKPASLPPIREVLEVGDWTDGWDRSYAFRKPASDKPVKLSQHLFELTPYYARIDANSVDHLDPHHFYYYPWSSFYRTSELGPAMVANLLTREQQARLGPAHTDDDRVKRRLEIFNFFVQTGWMDEAEKELARLRKDFPKAKETLDTAAEGIKKLSAMDRLDAIKQAMAAGRHEAAQTMLGKFPTDNADDQTQAEVRTLKVRYDNAATALKKAKALLEKLPKEVGVGDDPKLFAEAAAAISAELSIDHCLKKGDNDEGRLERFLTQADQAERFAKMKLGHLKASELLSLAVTSWLLGSASAESKPETAIRVWNARRFVLDYLKTAAAARGKLLKDYQDAKPLSVPEIAQLIPNLPPIDPPAKITTAETTMTVGGGTKGTKYQLKLPPEYHPGRAYPVLIALHHSGESGKDMVKRWGDEAGQWGYILACPDWGTGPYEYSVAEHAVVLETLRDLRQHFNVDSDRVFLTGYGEGGNMAWDVGLSHPDLFAGVAPIAGQPRFQAKVYWTNVMELPFYVVWGEYMGGPNSNPKVKDKEDANVVNFNQFKDEWIPRGAPAIGVLYRGRGLEWFPAEVTDIFEWMSQKRRHNPMKIGCKDIVVNSERGETRESEVDIRILREEDNHFYWISVEGLTSKSNRYSTLVARVLDGNRINLVTYYIKHVRVWLGRGMIDFSKPVTVQRGSAVKTVMATPNLAVLLEDFLERGDRQRLFFARIDI